MSDLFRKSALENRQEGLLGDVVVLVPRSQKILAGFFGMFLLGGILVLMLLQHVREQNVRGYLLPSKGLIRVTTPQAGVLAATKVVAGAKVHKGEVLFEITAGRTASGIRNSNEDLVREVTQKRASLRSQLSLAKAMEQNNIANVKQHVAVLRARVKSLSQQLEDSRKALAINQDNLKKYRTLAEKGISSKTEYGKHYEDMLARKSRLNALALQLAEARLGIQDAPQKINREKLDYANKVAELKAAIADTQQQLINLQVQGTFYITAPVDGTVANITAETGQPVDPQSPLAAIVRNGSDLEALLMVPSSAVGLIRPGQSVIVDYDAFPYTRFGYGRGVIKNISKSVVTSSMIHAPLTAHMPFYIARVKLTKQSVEAAGQRFPLQPDMALNAHVVLAKESWLTWIGETITGLAAN